MRVSLPTTWLCARRGAAIEAPVPAAAATNRRRLSMISSGRCWPREDSFFSMRVTESSRKKWRMQSEADRCAQDRLDGVELQAAHDRVDERKDHPAERQHDAGDQSDAQDFGEDRMICHVFPGCTTRPAQYQSMAAASRAAHQRGAAAPIATGRTGEPEAPCVRSGRMMVQDSQTLSPASAPRLAFWMLWMPACARLW